ncbi:MAG: glycerophosphodiester phosphodiesterase [Lachnospiraceae bacterium]|nr:glycerophosphodiester phosphodiesterase [Lachnospiraceae bacterium]
MIMPHMFGKPDVSPFLDVYYAHRGLHDNHSGVPENSLLAFGLAAEQGYGIEMDVRLTKDEQAVVFHDDTLKRICGLDRWVNSMTYEELKKLSLLGTEERIPLFSEALEVIGGRVPLIIEIKMVDSRTRVCELVDRILQNYQGQYCMESFHPIAVYWYKKHRPEIVRGQLSADFPKEGERETFPMWIVHHLLANFLARPDFISYSHKGAGVPARRICRSLYRNLSVAWTIRSEEELEKARRQFDLFIFEGFRPK